MPITQTMVAAITVQGINLIKTEGKGKVIRPAY